MRSDAGQPGPERGGPGMAALDDAALVAAWRADPEGPRGRQAVSALLARHRRRVLAWCWEVVRDRELALDLAQDVLVSAWKALGSYEEKQRFAAWLFTIARNRCLSELRRRRVPLAEEAVLELVADARPGPDAQLAQRSDGEALLRLVRETLTREEQDALWLRCYEGLPVEAITRRLGLSEASGARAVLQRARRKLRAALGRADDGEG